jgi:histidinol-phosphate aminotransferase
MAYERKNIAEMSGYVPGEQPTRTDVIKLNTNENPYPPGEGVIAALHNVSADHLRRYPNPTARGFREAAAEYHGVTPDHIIATNGGDELLRLLVTTFVDPGQVIGTAEPSYSLYPVLAAVQDARIKTLQLDDVWQLPANFARALNKAGAKLAFIVNPHAPSGRLTSVDRLSEMAEQFKGVLVIDEAYVDFVDPDLEHESTELVRDHDNVVLLRSLSKGYSLAGLRFGYGIGRPELIEPMLTKTRDSYNTDVVAQALATAAITHHGQAEETWHKVRRERLRISEQLAMTGCNLVPSQANFILVEVDAAAADGSGAAGVYQTLKDQDILVRYFDQDRLRDKLRITIGTPQQNDTLLKALADLLDVAVD